MQHVNEQGNPERTSQIGTPDHRQFMIQVAAYQRAASRHFQGGNPAQDRIDAVREVDAKLKGTRYDPRVSTN